jgi:hypothetical protein
MRKGGKFVAATLIAGLFALAPIYLATLLLLKATESLQHVVKPLTNLFPA